MEKPVIGILAPCVWVPGAGGVTSPAMKLSASYTEAVAAAGGLPMLIPFTREPETVRELLSLCDGAIFPGGGDVDPRYFGEDPHPLCGPMDQKRDAWEMAALQYLWEEQIPVLGICRGCQIMNIFAGGTIYQDLSLTEASVILHRADQPLSSTVHLVKLTPDSFLRPLLKADEVYTNSSHHQAVKDLGCGFSVSAKTDDGVVEAIEHENGIWFGIQWHPETLVDSEPRMLEIFRKLVEKASK